MRHFMLQQYILTVVVILCNNPLTCLCLIWDIYCVYSDGLWTYFYGRTAVKKKCFTETAGASRPCSREKVFRVLFLKWGWTEKGNHTLFLADPPNCPIRTRYRRWLRRKHWNVADRGKIAWQWNIFSVNKIWFRWGSFMEAVIDGYVCASGLCNSPPFVCSFAQSLCHQL